MTCGLHAFNHATRTLEGLTPFTWAAFDARANGYVRSDALCALLVIVSTTWRIGSARARLLELRTNERRDEHDKEVDAEQQPPTSAAPLRPSIAFSSKYVYQKMSPATIMTTFPPKWIAAREAGVGS